MPNPTNPPARGSSWLVRAAALAAALLLVGVTWSYTATAQSYKVLVFHKTGPFRHTSIDEGIAAIRELGVSNSFGVDETLDASKFTDANLAQYRVIIFLSTTGDVLNDTQQGALERYIANGGGWVGIHAASDTEYDWPWYGGLVGAYFLNHPPGTAQATINVADRSHPSTAHLGTTWQRTDEWYNFQTNPRGSVSVLMTLDETSYTGGTMGADHPIAWYHLYDGGRAWYTALGHTEASFGEQAFLDHILGGIQWAAERPAQPSAAPSSSAAPSPSSSAAPSPSSSPAPSSPGAVPKRCLLPMMQR